MHLSLFSPRGGAAGYPLGIRQFKKKLGSNSPLLGKMWCLKSLGRAIRFVILFDLEIPDEVSNFPPQCIGAVSDSLGLGLVCCLIPLASPMLPLWMKILIGALRSTGGL